MTHVETRFNASECQAKPQYEQRAYTMWEKDRKFDEPIHQRHVRRVYGVLHGVNMYY